MSAWLPRCGRPFTSNAWIVRVWRGVRRRAGGDGGSGTILAIGTVGAMVTVVVGAVAVAGAASAHARAAAAADLAALAAADAASGRVPGVVCEAADAVARANGAELTACAQTGRTVVVTVVRSALGMQASVSARAGPRGGGDVAAASSADGDAGVQSNTVSR